MSAGISATAAKCIYEAIADDPTAATLAPQITALTDGLRNGGTDVAVDPASLQPLLVTVAPCLDSATLLAMTSALGGGTKSGNGAAGGGSFGAVLTSLFSAASTGGGTPSLAGLSKLLQLDGSAATAQQIAAVTKLLSDPGALLDVQNGQVDLAILKNLDLRSLSEEQARALLLIFANQLTTGQQRQLEQIANVTLDELQLSINPDNLTNEERGSLLLLLSPFISAGLKPLVNRAPNGQPVDQIYVPNGLDLSDVNPLLFVSRDSAIAGFAAQGIDAAFGGCLYDRVRLLDPQTLGRAFIGTDTTGTLQLALSVLTCVINQ